MDNFAPLDSSGSSGPVRASNSRGKADEWHPILPVPDTAPPAPSMHPKRGKPAAHWTYLDEQGRTLMYVLRFDKNDGGKDIVPLTYCARSDVREWRWKGLVAPRPLYNLDQLHARQKAPVLIVEGEKATEAAVILYPDYVVTTWPGGSKAAAKSNWQPLARRNVTLWPDADGPGHEAMQCVANYLKDISTSSLRLVMPPDGVPVGWDAADAVEEITAGDRARHDVVSLVVNAEPCVMTDETGTTKTDSNKGGDKPKRKSYDDYLSFLGDIDLWHSPTKEPWASVGSGGGTKNYRIDGPAFATWLDYACEENGAGVPSREIAAKMIASLKARAIHNGPERKVFLRVAGDLKVAVYFDLGRDDGQAIELRPNGWKVIDNPPVKFRRVMSMQPLPLPEEDGSVDEIWTWINCQTEDDKKMVLAFILASMMPEGPYPLLVLSGPPGASKSVTSKIIRSLIDPSAVPLSGAPGKPGDFTSVLENSRLLVFDNIAKIPQWLSDLLCMVATGSGIRQRRLHTNTGEVLIEGGRPAILNGIGDLTTRPDLANRCVIVNLESAPIRRAEHLKTSNGEAFWSEFSAAQPRILGGLYGTFCAAMKFYNEGINLPGGNPRMVDFAIWGNAVGAAMGWEAGVFDAAYKTNRTMADEIALEDSFLWKHLETLFSPGAGEWTGTAAELKVKIELTIDNATERKRFESIKPSTVGKELSRIKLILNQKGWKVLFHRGSGARTWHITSPESVD